VGFSIKVKSSAAAALIGLVLAGCAGPGFLSGFPDLTEAMSATEVEAVWGKPSNVLHYATSEGQEVRWEFRRKKVEVQGEWIYLPVGPGGRQTMVYQPRSTAREALAAWAVFREDRLLRWAVYGF